MYRNLEIRAERHVISIIFIAAMMITAPAFYDMALAENKESKQNKKVSKSNSTFDKKCIKLMIKLKGEGADVDELIEKLAKAKCLQGA